MFQINKCFWGILLVFSVLCSGCLKTEDIQLKSIKNVTYQDFKGNSLTLEAVAVIDNPNRMKVKIKDANLDLLLNDKKVGRITQIEQIELLARTEKDYNVQLSVELTDLMSNLPALYRVLMNETANFQLSGSVQVSSFLYKKTFNVDRVSFR